jgi:hypothetical protein
MSQNFTARELRDWAARCRRSAENAANGPERAKLHKSERALEKIADQIDAESGELFCIEFILPEEKISFLG